MFGEDVSRPCSLSNWVGAIILHLFRLQANGTAMVTNPMGHKLYYIANSMVFRNGTIMLEALGASGPAHTGR